MNHRLIIRQEAEQDLADAAQWYEEERNGLGREFLSEARDAIKTIVDRPLSFPIVDSPIRRALMQRFPYAIYYVPDLSTVAVIAVTHLKRHPNRWRSRFT